MLCAWLIGHIRETSNLPVACCFSSSHAHRIDDFDSIIRTWIAELAQSNISVLNTCLQIRRKQPGRRASKNEVWRLLREILGQMPSCILALDGLDEFSIVNDARSVFLKDLKQAVASTGARVLVTSRMEVDIESALGASQTQLQQHVLLECRISKEDVEGDVGLYSQSVVAHKFPRQSEAFRQELSAQMAENSGGMFLWIKLQQSQLRGSQNMKTVHRIVQGMPQGLYHTYTRNWNSIQELVEPDRNRAVNILRWLVYGYGEFTVEEMAEALIIELDEACEAFSEDDLPAEIDAEYSNNEIKGLCHSLVELRDGNEDASPQLSTVHLVHASVREYLVATLPVPPLVESPHNQVSPSAVHHVALAAYCLRFLNCPQAWYEGDGGEARPFTTYAVRSCFKHVRDCGLHYGSVSGLVHEFMVSENTNFQNWRSRYEDDATDLEAATGHTDLIPPVNPSALYYACLFGLFTTMDILYEKENASVDSLGGQFGTALQAACAEGLQGAFDRLIRWGADVTVQGGRYHSAINAAAYHGRDGMVKALLDSEPRICQPMDRTHEATRTAVRQGHDEVVRLLLHHRAVVLLEQESDLDMSLLLSDSLLDAAQYGHTAIVDLLLERGADVDARDDDDLTPLHRAAAWDHLEVAKVLLQCGAFVDSHGEHGSPLHFAACYGNLRVATALIEEGANIELRRLNGLTPLLEAANNGNANIVALLLDHGGDINAQANSGRTALTHALSQDHNDVATLLLDKGADVNLGNVRGMKPIHYASVGMIPLLIERGADPNSEDENGMTRLHLAALNGETAVVEMLLQHGAEIKTDHFACTALHFAVWNAHGEITTLLLRSGADPNARNRHGVTPLDFMCRQKRPLGLKSVSETLDSLLECGARYSKDDDGWLPIHLAAHRGRHEVVSAFLDQGYSVNAQDDDGRTPLLLAVRENHTETAELMLRRGADSNIADKFGETPLRKAIEAGSDELIKTLMQQGAEITAVDEYGMTCLDWLKRLRPRLLEPLLGVRAIENVASGPDVAVLKRSAAERAARIRKNKQGSIPEPYHFAKCLLMLGRVEDAVLAYQVWLLIPEDGPYQSVCDNCQDIQTRDEPLYTCRTCPTIDFCQECMSKYEKEPLHAICRDHDFLRAVASEARIRPDQTEAFDAWLLGIEERLRTTDVSENVPVS